MNEILVTVIDMVNEGKKEWIFFTIKQGDGVFVDRQQGDISNGFRNIKNYTVWKFATVCVSCKVNISECIRNGVVC